MKKQRNLDNCHFKQINQNFFIFMRISEIEQILKSNIIISNPKVKFKP